MPSALPVHFSFGQKEPSQCFLLEPQLGHVTMRRLSLSQSMFGRLHLLCNLAHNFEKQISERSHKCVHY